jgi:hypothetical protein
MEVNKAQWPEGTTVTLEGYYSPEGEMLNSEPHTQEFVDAWNGVKAKSLDLPETGDTTTSKASPEKTKVKPKKAKKKWFKKK